MAKLNLNTIETYRRKFEDYLEEKGYIKDRILDLTNDDRIRIEDNIKRVLEIAQFNLEYYKENLLNVFRYKTINDIFEFLFFEIQSDISIKEEYLDFIESIIYWFLFDDICKIVKRNRFFREEV